jgi:biotin-dependent carboxylase-like uncharacterized protein
MIEALRVVDGGLFTTVQDRGRPGYRGVGVPVGGAFDREAMGLANALAGNPDDWAVLEMTLRGGVYEAIVDLALGLAGSPMRAAHNEMTLSVPSCFTLRAGCRLEVGGCATGARTYLAVRGGWQTAEILGSRSCESRLEAGHILRAIKESRTMTRHPLVQPETASPIRVMPGPDATGIVKDWRERPYRVGQRIDRMGVRLESADDLRRGPELGERLSAPVAPGTIQMAGGQLIVLGVACGTMGGYPHVGQVIGADLDRLGQLRPGREVRFEEVTIEEARRVGATARDEGEVWRRRIRTMVRDGA